jgi:hypothetical protein
VFNGRWARWPFQSMFSTSQSALVIVGPHFAAPFGAHSAYGAAVQGMDD